MDKKLEAHLKRCTNLPSLPSVAARIVDLGQDPTAGMREVADAVMHDPALTAKILRIANSPLYAQRRQCNNFRQALVLLGLNATLTLALTFSLASSLRRQTTKGMDYDAFWRRSLLAAVCSRAIGDHLKIALREELFLAGLLQDLGMLALDKAVPELYPEIADEQQDHERLCAAERERLGTDHAEAGAWLLNSWNLPNHLQHAVAGSHELQPGSGHCDELIFCKCVYLSGRLADVLLEEDRNGSYHAVGQVAKKHLGLDGEALTAVLNAVAQEVPDVEALFETDLIDSARLEVILEEAKETLILRNLQALKEASDIRETAESLEEKTRALEERVRRDNLTKVFNRGHLNEALVADFAQANEHGWPISLAFVDLDHFKEVNDNHGHSTGDQVLIEAAKLLTGALRKTDFVARYGGEEFVLVLPGTGSAAAQSVCERIRNTFAHAHHDVDSGGSITVTVSIGLATHGETYDCESTDELLKQADNAMYMAKRNGRNQLVLHEPEPPQPVNNDLTPKRRAGVAAVRGIAARTLAISRPHDVVNV